MHILFFGDSNIAGWRPDAMQLYDPGVSFASRVQLAYPGTVVDGTPGLSAHDAKLTIAAKPDIVIFMIGVNDLRQYSAEQIIARINDLLAPFENSKKLYIVHPGIQFSKLKGMWLELFQGCEQKQEAFFKEVAGIDAELLDLRGTEILGQDGVHLNVLGHEYVFQHVMTWINSNMEAFAK